MRNTIKSVLDSLIHLGFEVKRRKGTGYSAKSDSFGMYCYLKKADDSYLICRFMLPNVVRVPKRGYVQYLEMVNEINEMIMDAKVIIYNKSIWSIHEFCIIGDECMEDRIENALSALRSSALLIKMKTDALFIP